ncbi:MAG: hypothetical protein EOO74_08460 [Myxococcales bacterium]|nr:MAG: hypothetical protein EOO74_08460 [Myxococcales bacterium]
MSRVASLPPFTEDETLTHLRTLADVIGLTGWQKATLSVLLMCAAEKSRRPRVPLESLACYVGCTEKRALQTVDELEALGLVRVVLREVAQGQRKLRPAVYEVDLVALAALRRPGAGV